MNIRPECPKKEKRWEREGGLLICIQGKTGKAACPLFCLCTTRADDVVCRYGGEEFTVILPEISTDTCLNRAELLREQAGRLNVFHNGQTLGGVTMSLGVALFPHHGSSGQALLEAADAALYQAKHEGRNRVVVAGQPSPQAAGQAREVPEQ